MPPHVGALLLPLRALVASLSIARRLPQIELAIGEEDAPRDLITVLVLRILDPLLPADEAKLTAFAAEHGVVLWLQPKGPDTARPFAADSPDEFITRVQHCSGFELLAGRRPTAGRTGPRRR